MKSLLLKDENSDLVKKSSFSVQTKKPYGKQITHDLERTIVGMLNGVVEAHILVGVDKNNKPVGIGQDFEFIDAVPNGTWL